LVPFLGHRDGTQPLAWRSGRFVSVAEFLADVETLAERLPRHTHAVNLCRDRYCFAVAFAAAMVRGQINLLPATQAGESLRELQRAYQSVYLLVDDEQLSEEGAVRVDVGSGSAQFPPGKLAFAPDQAAAIAFTSGSTGEPVPSAKSWGALALGGSSEASYFGLLADSTSVIVGTVPPQHMYGLETTVLMPLRGGLIMHHGRPFFPADVHAALASVDADRVLVSTPVHLRALLASGIELPALRLAICATAPLSEETAREFENRFGVEVHEVYGFTEAGMVATRRTLNGPQWRLLAGLKMRQADGSVLLSGGHVPGEVASADVIEVVDDAHFVLRGRGADLVNIAGKRTSISYLDHQLCEIEGVEDGAFFLPDNAGDDVVRLTAFAVAPGMKREQLLAALSRSVDPVFVPRPLHLVDSLPRNATGKLARKELAKLALEELAKLARSELVKLTKHCAGSGLTQSVVVNRNVDPAHPALPGHFPGDPIVPGAVLLDEILDALTGELGSCAEFAAVTIRSAKFLRPVRPGDSLQIKLIPGDDAALRFECSVAGETAVNGALTLVAPADQ
jgi:acyl-coenzyme A synthetase/AMP-(fatty) acid ligase/3-hydroxymyristoyl/3-hydroxydecanoyl-(acyl carrier protein) dehydratase